MGKKWDLLWTEWESLFDRMMQCADEDIKHLSDEPKDTVCVHLTLGNLIDLLRGKTLRFKTSTIILKLTKR